MRKEFLVICALMTMITLTAQTSNDSIIIKNRLGPVYYQNDKILKVRQLVEIMQVNPQAYELMKKAKSQFDVSYALGLAGGFCLGYGLGPLIRGEDPNWELMAVGGAIIGVSIPFSAAYNRHSKEAVRMYNEGLSAETDQIQTRLTFGLSSNGLGIKLIF